MQPIHRPTARILLINADRQVLLFQVADLGGVFDPNDPPGTVRPERYWILPGGGVETGESLADAARRELLEETGLMTEIGPCLFEHDQLLSIQRQQFLFQERFFFVETDSPDIWVHGNNQAELATYRTHRWWSLADLEQTTETVFPKGLAAELRSALREQPS